MKKQIILGLMAIGFITGCSTSRMDYSALPSPVRQTVHNTMRAYPDAKIVKVARETSDGCCIYRIEFCAAGTCGYTDLRVYADGRIVSS